MKLTAKTVATLNLPAGKTDIIYFDAEIAGFGYRMRAGAGDQLRRSWVVQYRHAGATRRIHLGAAAVMSAEVARAAAKQVLAKVALGEDPQADRRGRREKDRQTFRALVGEYLAGKKVRPRTMVELKRYLTDSAYFGPLFGMPADGVTRKDIAARLVVIARSHGAITGSRARAALSAFYVWALQSGLVDANPVVGTAKPAADTPRERVLSDPELAAVWRACEDDAFGICIRLLILTGARRSEIGGLRAGELDLEAAKITIAAARAKNGRAHLVPLVPMALELLEGVPRMAGRDLLFGSRSAAGFVDWHRGKRALDDRSGVTGWTIHDLRRSTATGLANLGTQPHVIEAILNHARRGVAGIYNRSSYDREVKAALALWADHIRALVEGSERKVLPFVAS